MQPWVCLTSRAFDSEGADIIVNADLIEVVEPHELGSCVHMSSGKLVVAKETIREVLDEIMEASGIVIEGEAEG